MKQVIFGFVAILATLLLFVSCKESNVDDAIGANNQIESLETSENQANDNQSESDEPTLAEASSDNEEGGDASYKSHYDDSWWQSEKYAAIAKDMKEKGYYIDPEYLPSNFDGKLKLSIYDEANEYETSLKDELLAVYTMYWFFNDERIEKSARMMFVPKEGELFKSSLKELFDEAIALRPDFGMPSTKFAKDVSLINRKLQLFNEDYHLMSRGCGLEVKSNSEGLNLAYDDIDRLFVIIGPDEDKRAKIAFALLIEATQE